MQDHLINIFPFQFKSTELEGMNKGQKMTIYRVAREPWKLRVYVLILPKKNLTKLCSMHLAYFFFVQGIENDFINIQENYTSRVQLHF